MKKISIQENIKNRKVVEHNELITSIAKMNKTPLKIFELAVSVINTDNPPKDNIVYLSKKELFSFFDVTDGNKHTRFKEAIQNMQQQAFFEIKEETNRGFNFTSINPLPVVRWNDYNDEVMIEFNRLIMPYLIDLKSNFTQYAIADIMELNSKYSIILYKWIAMNFNQFEKYEGTSNRTKKQLNQLKHPYISIHDLRLMTDTVNEYSRFSNFEKRVLAEPLAEINENTHFSVTYEKVKKGRTNVGVQFNLSKSKIHSTNKESFHSLKDNKEIEKQKLFTEAMKSPYTQLLGTNNLIGFIETTDINLMSNLQKEVYPLYDDLKKIKGYASVIDHIYYVSNHITDSCHRNIVKYLKQSIKQYLNTVKIQQLDRTN